jgi:diguanylate cyclase
MMNMYVLDLLYGLASMLLGALGASWLSWSYFRRKAKMLGSTDAHHASRVLDHLQDLATRVAFDVDKHNDRVEEINASLVSTKKPEPEMIVDVVAKLIEANQQMHERLASTEDKLREQAQEIETHATEARTDALTLLLNRRAFDDELNRRMAEYFRQGRPFSLIMADVDNFKEFNDAHGHLIGDEILRGVAKMLRRKMREIDMVARYGGEEFAIILPGSNLADAEKAALKACENIDKTSLNQSSKELHVTMSFGVAEITNRDDHATLVSRADKALYAAKEEGRNCVYLHDGETVHRAISPKQPDAPKADAQPADDPPQVLEDAAGSAISLEDGILDMDDELPPRERLDIYWELPNRSTFCQQVRNRTAEWKRGGSIFSIVLIEVDPNDGNGGCCSQRDREIGIEAATKFLKATIREMDILGRYGPGCFAILLPTATLANAIHLTQQLREGFSLAQGERPPLTLSIGVVQIREEDDSISVLKRAEAALDAADRRGGDRAYCHDGKRCAPITAMLETLDYLS